MIWIDVSRDMPSARVTTNAKWMVTYTLPILVKRHSEHIAHARRDRRDPVLDRL